MPGKWSSKCTGAWLVLLLVVLTSRAAIPCPERCLCFRTTVRCMFLQLETIPDIPIQTTILDLRFNRIREIPANIFKDLKHVNTLLLNNNHINRLESGAFLGLKELRYLYLYKNRIKTIDGKAFQGLTKLEQLYLHFNRIETLDADTFFDLGSLDRLFLHNNKLSRIHPEAFRSLNSLRRLRLDSNALICDCRIMWLTRMLKDKQPTTQVAATCQFPANLQGKPLLSVPEREFRCTKPSFTEEPNDVNVNFGGTAYFSCKAEGDPNPDIVWFHNSNEIYFDEDAEINRYSLLNDGTLMVENTQMVENEDHGFYECKAKNIMGEVKSRSVKILHRNTKDKNRRHHLHASAVVQQKDQHFESSNLQFEEKPQDQEVLQGDTIELNCKATGVPHPAISWTRDDQPFPLSQRLLLSPFGKLTIRDIQLEDDGIYKCTATNYLSQISAVAQVRVQVPPRFSERPVDQSIAEGRFVEFTCKAEAYPEPHLTWKKDGRTIVPDTRIIIDLFGTNLRISNVRKSDEGLYQCRAQNIAGAVDTTANLTVKERIPPTFRRTPHNMETISGANVQLPCEARGDPPPVILWRKDGVAMNEDSRHRFSSDGSLFVYNIEKKDEGMYECKADNGIGYLSTFAHVRVKDQSGGHPGDRFVQISYEEASKSVDRAYNETLRNLYTTKDRPYTPAELLRLFRFPGPSARELARAAEIYERTLLIIKRHVESGAQFNLSDFSYTDALSPSHLEMIANLSGCLVHRHLDTCNDMCFHGRYRSYDGTCNNLQHPMWGASETAFYRLLKPIYDNGFNTPIGWSRSASVYNGFTKPSGRLVSMRIISTDDISPDEFYSHMLMQWGQFLDHDLDLAPPTISSESFVDGEDCSQGCEYSPPCFPIDIPPIDPRSKTQKCMEFTRSSPICGSGSTSLLFENVMPREQINVLTAYIDASQVYGSSEKEARFLRDFTNSHGLLRKGIPATEGNGKPLMPFSDNWPIDCRRDPRESNIGCFLGGDIRVNEQLGLAAMHTIWFREHNRIADALRLLNNHWDGDTLYHEARKIVGAQMQHITYEQWLPKIFGSKGMKMLGSYNGYNPNVEAAISNAFATAALRFGHTLINPILHRLNSTYQPIPQGNIALSKAFFSPFRIVEEGGIDPLLRGLFFMPAKLRKSDQLLNKELTELLFRQVHAVALDLAAINIQRGRDHALPGYNEWRKMCNLTYAQTFHDLRHEIRSRELRDRLRQLYGHPNNIDLWVGGVSEDLAEGARIGPTFLCILVDQFRRLRDGDRFFYQNPGVFKPEQLTQIRQSSLSRVLCDNGDKIEEATLDAFTIPQQQNPPLLSCSKLPQIDLRVWTECCNDCSRSGDFNTISRFPTNSRSRRELHFSYPKDTKSSSSINQTLAGDSSRESMLVEFKEGYVPLPFGHEHRTDEQLNGQDEDIIEERVEGMEEVIQQVQKQLRQLRKKFKQLETECRSNGRSKQCRDSKGIARDHGEEWDVDICSRCRCEDQQITCQVQTCPTLSCEMPVLHENECCPAC